MFLLLSTPRNTYEEYTYTHISSKVVKYVRLMGARHIRLHSQSKTRQIKFSNGGGAQKEREKEEIE